MYKPTGWLFLLALIGLILAWTMIIPQDSYEAYITSETYNDQTVTLAETAQFSADSSASFSLKNSQTGQVIGTNLALNEVFSLDTSLQAGSWVISATEPVELNLTVEYVVSKPTLPWWGCIGLILLILFFVLPILADS